MIHYSPKPIKRYPWACNSTFLTRDPLAWNLAWLSYAPEHGSQFNPQFTSAVSQTCSALLFNGGIDLLDRAPVRDKVAGLMQLPPPAAVHRLTNAAGLFAMPLYKLFGANWLRVMTLRAREYSEPFDSEFDAPVSSLADAEFVLTAF